MTPGGVIGDSGETGDDEQRESLLAERRTLKNPKQTHLFTPLLVAFFIFAIYIFVPDLQFARSVSSSSSLPVRVLLLPILVLVLSGVSQSFSLTRSLIAAQTR